MLAVAGDTLVTVALAGSLFFSISPEAARGRVALYLLCTIAPFAALSPLVGPTLDRFPASRRMLMALAAGLRALLCLSMARHLQSLWLFPEAFALLVLSKVHLVAKGSLVPEVVDQPERLVAANARLAVAGAVGGLLAALPGLAVMRIDSLGSAWAVRLAAVAYLASAVSGLRVPTGLRSAAPDPSAQFDAGPAWVNPPVGDRYGTSSAPSPLPLGAGAGTACAEGAAEVSAGPVPGPGQHGGIPRAGAAVGALRAIAGLCTFGLAFAFRAAGAPAWWFGLVLGLSALGSLLGSALASRLRSYLDEERIVQASLAAVALACGTAMAIEGWPGAATVGLILGMSGSAAKMAFDSIIQRDAPDSMRARTFARIETRLQIAWAVGAGVAVVIPLGSDPTLGLGGAVGIAALAYWYLEPLSRSRRSRLSFAAGRFEPARAPERLSPLE
ncbi:MAG: hypothetical protein ACT4OS_11375 [Acidimicrobiales bacterium]